MKKSIVMLLLAGFLTVGLIGLTGCKEESEPVTPPPDSNAPETASATIEQTTCPVMAGAIDKNIFVEYQGQKVYFCCPGCKQKFEEEPQKYLVKLPQFKK